MSTLEDQLRDYLTALHRDDDDRSAATYPISNPAPQRGHRRFAVLLAAAVVAAIAVAGAVALRGSEASAPVTETAEGPEVPQPATLPPFTTQPSEAWSPLPADTDQCQTWSSLGPTVWIPTWEGGAACTLLADFQSLEIANKGSSSITLSLEGIEHPIGVDDSYTTAPVGELLGEGTHILNLSPHPPLTVTVTPAAESQAAAWTCSAIGAGPFRLGDALPVDDPRAVAMSLTYGEDPTPVPTCRTVVSSDDPYAPLVTVAQTPEGHTVVASVAVSSPTLAGPGGIHVGMTQEQLETASDLTWSAASIPMLTDTGRTFLGWADPASGTEIVAVLESGTVGAFIIRPSDSTLRDLPGTTGCQFLA